MGRPPLFEGEENILQAPGSLQERRYGRSWKLGNLYLTDRRLFLIQGTGRPFEMYLDEIMDLEVVKRGWLLGVSIKQLCVSFRSGRVERVAYIGVEKPERWVEAINERITLMLASKKWRYHAADPGP